MTNDSSLDRAALSLSALRRIDERSARFEAAWNAGETPNIEDFLNDVSEPERSALFRELLLSELEMRKERRAPREEAAYHERFPLYGGIIHAAVAEAEQSDAGAAEDLSFLQPSTKPKSLGRLGHYEVLQVIGQGGFGVVLRAFDEVLQRVVAVKVMSPKLATTSPPRKRFLREARSAGGIHHDNVVQIHAVEEQPIPYLVMEYIHDETLQQRLDRTGPLELAEILRIGQLTANGLAAAHAKHLIHRDIKPGNILLESTVEQRVKVTDFGLARTVDDASMTQSGIIAGTPIFMAPEQAAGEALDCRADLFSLGSVLYVMAVGHPPFRAPTTVAVLKRVVENTPRPIREVIPELPQWLEDLIGKLHAKKPAERFQTAKEVADLLGRRLAELQNDGRIRDERRLEPPSSAKAETHRPAIRRRPWLVLTGGFLLLTAAALGLTDALGLTSVIRLFAPDAAPIGKANREDGKNTLDKKSRPSFADAPFETAKALAHQEAWAKFLDTTAFTSNSIGMKFALIPPGSFAMGSPGNEPFRNPNEGPMREVRLTKPFAMGVNAVTVGQFKVFVLDSGYRTDAESSGLGAYALKENTFEMDANANWHNPGFDQSDDHPVVCISWNDAKAFCAWLSDKEHKKYALPTEAQWEYACRAGTQTSVFFGNGAKVLSEYAWHKANAERRTHPVGEKKPNAWGLHDMHGNVFQWVADWHSGAYYATAPRDDPPGPDAGEYRALRGGDWDCGPDKLRSAYRGFHVGQNTNGGFRVVCELAQ